MAGARKMTSVPAVISAGTVFTYVEVVGPDETDRYTEAGRR